MAYCKSGTESPAFNPSPAMKRVIVTGLISVVAAALSGCGSISQKDRSADVEARTYFGQHRQTTEQTVKNIEGRVSHQGTP